MLFSHLTIVTGRYDIVLDQVRGEHEQVHGRCSRNTLIAHVLDGNFGPSKNSVHRI